VVRTCGGDCGGNMDEWGTYCETDVAGGDLTLLTDGEMYVPLP